MHIKSKLSLRFYHRLHPFTSRNADNSFEASPNVEARVNALLAQMTLEEKLGQLQQLDGEAAVTFVPNTLS